jgi:predicted ArsR family transcriptional regulator
VAERHRTHEALAVASRVQIIDTLRASARALTAGELASACGLHVSTVRFHLDILARAGLVHSRSEPTGTRGRPRHLYTPTTAGGPESSAGTGYQLLASLLAAHWDGTADERSTRAERAGRAAAGAQQRSESPPRSLPLREAVAEVAGTFAELGFEPELVTEGAGVQMRLHACPFRAVAVAHPEVVCSLHLGLIRGALDGLGGAAAASSLEPFVEPHLCIAHVIPAEQVTAQ